MHVLAEAAGRGISMVLAGPADNLRGARHLLPAAEAAVLLEVELERDVDVDDDVVARALELHRALPFDGVVCHREYALVAAARISEALGLPDNPSHVVAATRDKSRTRDVLTAAGFAQPATERCRELGEARTLVSAGVGSRWIFKPPTGVASAGVSVVERPEGTAEAWRRARKASADGSVIVEEFIDAVEYSVEGVVWDETLVVALTEKLTTGPPHFIELGHRIPAPIDAGDRTRVRRTVTAALGTLGVERGLFHVEVFVTPRDVYVGDVHTRAGGDCIPVLVKLAYGIEFYGLSFDQLLDRPQPSLPEEPLRHAGIVYFSMRPGVLRKLAGIDRAASVPGVEHVHLEVEPGGVVPALTWSFDRPGWAIVTAPTRSLLLDRMSVVENSLEVEYATVEAAG